MKLHRFKEQKTFIYSFYADKIENPDSYKRSDAQLYPTNNQMFK